MKSSKFSIIILAFSSKKERDQTEEWYEYVNKKYQTNKSFFKPEFISHFPKDLFNIDNIGNTVIGEEPGLDCVTFIQGVKYSNSIFDSISNILIQNSIESYSSEDSIFLVYNQFVNGENVGFKRSNTSSEMLKLQMASDAGLLPIPNFWNYYKQDFDIAYNLPGDFVVYVNEAMTGKFWDDIYLMNKDLMPDKWQHGYSKGSAISKKRLEIIYWFIIW